MAETSYFTQEGLDKLKAELNHLKKVERPSVTVQIADARDKGDLSENAEYDAAKEAQNAAKKHLVETVGTRATVVILGANGARIAVENNGAWADAAALEAALGAGYTVADFDY